MEQSSTGSDGATDQASRIIPPEMQARYATAKWHYPSGHEMGQYPDRAAAQALPGVAVINCQIKPDGKLAPCVILSEAPEGYGFGVAAAKMFVKYVHVDPATVNGGIRPGDFRIFTFKWVIG